MDPGGGHAMTWIMTFVILENNIEKSGAFTLVSISATYCSLLTMAAASPFEELDVSGVNYSGIACCMSQ